LSEPENLDKGRENITGFGESSSRKSYYPELQAKLAELEQTKAELAAANQELLHSNAKLSRVVEQSPVSIVITDLAGTIEYVNPKFVEETGYTPAEAIGQNPRVLKSGKMPPETYRQLWAALTSGKEWRGELLNRKKNGELYWEWATISPISNESGKITNFLAVKEDITERKGMEAELNHERNLLRAMLDNTADRIYFKDLQSHFLRCSASQMRSFHAKGVSNVIGKTDHDFFSSEHANAALQDELQIIRTGEAIVGKVEKETWPDGGITWALTSKMPLRNEAGEIVGTFGISKDITAIKEAEAKVDAMHRELMDASRQAGMAEVATSVLHNVGNVLNSVNVSSSLIAEKVRQSKVSSLAKVVALLQTHEADLPGFFANNPQGKQLPSYLTSLATRLTQEQENVLNEIAALSANIQHIKEVVSMQQGHAKTVGMTETLPVVDMVEDALRLNLGSLDRHSVKLVREFSPVPPVAVEKHKVLQILVNLIRNAKHACDDSGRDDKQITLRVASSDGLVKISVEDNGVGIAPENLTRIFGHGFTTRKEGHGFGLHSGALAAKELGGTLKAFSAGPGQGAIFTLELPLKPAKVNP
jgi:PAS domain S-box-containing protein